MLDVQELLTYSVHLEIYRSSKIPTKSKKKLYGRTCNILKKGHYKKTGQRMNMKMIMMMMMLIMMIK